MPDGLRKGRVPIDILIKTKQHMFEPCRFFQSCHASTLAALPDGSVLAAWFAGTHENHVDVGIWTAMMRKGVWREPQRVAWDEEWPCWNPVLHVGDNGVVYLFYKVGRSPEQWRTMLKTSRDNGATWSEARLLVEGDRDGRGPVKNKPICLSDGRWLAPASREGGGVWDAYVDISADGGKTWTPSPPVPVDHSAMNGPGVIQPTLWESAPGRVHMLLRSSDEAIYRSDSCDGGLNWCTAYRTMLPNNNSGIDAVRMEDGTLALLYNPIGVNWGPRTPLALALSADNGETWPFTRVIEENLAPLDREDGEFSYPAVIARSSRLFICYTWRRTTIEFVELEVKP